MDKRILLSYNNFEHYLDIPKLVATKEEAIELYGKAAILDTPSEDFQKNWYCRHLSQVDKKFEIKYIAGQLEFERLDATEKIELFIKDGYYIGFRNPTPYESYTSNWKGSYNNLYEFASIYAASSTPIDGVELKLFHNQFHALLWSDMANKNDMRHDMQNCILKNSPNANVVEIPAYYQYIFVAFQLSKSVASIGGYNYNAPRYVQVLVNDANSDVYNPKNFGPKVFSLYEILDDITLLPNALQGLTWYARNFLDKNEAIAWSLLDLSNNDIFQNNATNNDIFEKFTATNARWKSHVEELKKQT